MSSKFIFCSLERQNRADRLLRLPWFSVNEPEMDPLVTALSKKNDQIHLKINISVHILGAMAKLDLFLLKEQQT